MAPAAVALVMAGGVAVAVTYAPSTPRGHKFWACLKGGSLTRVTERAKAPRCERGSHLVSWFQEGPRGRRGKTGPRGKRGPAGPSGPTGPPGPAPSFYTVQSTGNYPPQTHGEFVLGRSSQSDQAISGGDVPVGLQYNSSDAASDDYHTAWSGPADNYQWDFFFYSGSNDPIDMEFTVFCRSG